MADPLRSGRQAADRHSYIGARMRSDGGGDGAHPVFHPNNDDVTPTIQPPERPVRFTLKCSGLPVISTDEKQRERIGEITLVRSIQGKLTYRRIGDDTCRPCTGESVDRGVWLCVGSSSAEMHLTPCRRFIRRGTKGAP